jgi:hypothetical protein
MKKFRGKTPLSGYETEVVHRYIDQVKLRASEIVMYHIYMQNLSGDTEKAILWMPLLTPKGLMDTYPPPSQ